MSTDHSHHLLQNRSHNIINGTPGSKTDSEKTMTLEQWEEENKMDGMSWENEATEVEDSRKMKVEAIDKTKVWPK